MCDQACQRQRHWMSSGGHRAQRRGVMWWETSRHQGSMGNNEHDVTARRRAGWQAGTKEHTSSKTRQSNCQPARLHAVWWRRIVRHSSPNWHRGRIVGCVTCRVSKGVTRELNQSPLMIWMEPRPHSTQPSQFGRGRGRRGRGRLGTSRPSRR